MQIRNYNELFELVEDDACSDLPTFTNREWILLSSKILYFY